MIKNMIFAFVVIITTSSLYSATNRELYDKYWDEGAAFSDEGKWDKAVVSFTNAIKYHPKLPDNYGTYVNRANAYSMLGKLDLAIADYKKVIGSFTDKTAKELGEVYYNMGAAYHTNGKPELAIPQYEKAISIDSEIKSVHNKLAWLLATSPDPKIRDGKKAVEHGLIACKQTGNKNPGYLDTLSAAYAENGDFANAVLTKRKAIELLDDVNEKKDYTTRLELYESNKPYRAQK